LNARSHLRTKAVQVRYLITVGAGIASRIRGRDSIVKSLPAADSHARIGLAAIVPAQLLT